MPLPAIIPPLIMAAGAVGGALLGRKGQQDANKANREEAKKNRGFQERMRNTQWQAAVEDMRAAGINPALAYSQGGAASPSGSVAAKQENVNEAAVGTALAVKMQTEQIGLLRAQKQAAMATAMKTQEEGQIIGIERYFQQSRMSMYFNSDGTPKPAMRKLLEAEFSGKVATGSRSVSELNLSRLREPEMRAMADLFDRIGEGGKGIQQLLPFIISMMRRR